MTLELRVYLLANQKGTRVLFKQPCYQIGFQTSGASNRLYGGVWTPQEDPANPGQYYAAYSEATYGTALSLNRWYSVALTYKDGEGIKLYVDSRQVASASQSGFVQRSFQPVYIGWFGYFRGKIDEVNIYPARLTSSQISQNYIASHTSSTVTSESTNQQLDTAQPKNVGISTEVSQVAAEPSLMLLYTGLDPFRFSMLVLTSKPINRPYPSVFSAFNSC
jgi:hypothetical protein